MSKRYYIRVFTTLIAFMLWIAAPQAAFSCTISFHQGVEAIQSGRFADAVNAFTIAIQNAPTSSAYANRCLAHLELEHYADAIADCTSSLDQQSDQSEALLNRGLAYYRSENYQAAIVDTTNFLHFHPDDSRAYFNRALAKAALQQHWQALIDYDRALAQRPEDPATIAEIYTDRGLAYFALQDMPNAIANFTTAIALDTQDARAYYNRGCMYRWQGRFADAIADFTQAIALQPNHPSAYLDRGIAHAQTGRAQYAISDLKNAASLFEQQGQAIAYQQTVNLIQQLKSTRQTEIG